MTTTTLDTLHERVVRIETSLQSVAAEFKDVATEMKETNRQLAETIVIGRSISDHESRLRFTESEVAKAPQKIREETAELRKELDALKAFMFKMLGAFSLISFIGFPACLFLMKYTG